ncbi:MAG: hypothetical protein Q9216_007030 [Gyalolechia sp. 2 TL-2023]
MRLGPANFITFLLCSLFFCPIEAIFADEAYQADFHHVLLGAPQPRTTFFHRPSFSSQASLLYTLSDRSILGAVNPKDGSVVWRQQLRNGNGLLSPSTKGNVVISAVNGTVQAWDAAEGRLAWDWIGREKIKALVVSQNDRDGRGVYILTQNDGSKAHVRKLAQDSGAPIWEYQDERYFRLADGVAPRMMLTFFSGDMPCGLSVSEQGLFYVALHSALLQGSKITVTSLEASNGNAQSSITLSADMDLSDIQSVLSIESTRSSSLLVWSDRTLKSFRINILGTNHILTTRLSNEKETSLRKIQFHTLARDGGATDVLVHCQSTMSHWLEVYRLESKSENLEKSYQLPNVVGPAAFSIAIHSGGTYLVRTTKRDVTLFSSTSDNILGQWSLHAKSYDHLTQSSDIPHAVSEVVARGKSNFAVRSALLLSSGDWKMIHNGEELWSRPESLSGVVAAAWVETDGQQSLAEELAAESHSNIGKAYVNRITRHMRSAQDLLPWIKSLPDRTIYSSLGRNQRLQGSSSSGNNLGFHKLVVAATDSGRLFALDVGGSGKILWTIQASKVKLGQQWPVESIEVRNGVALVRVLGGGSLAVSVTQGVVLEDQLQSIKSGIKTAIAILNSPKPALSVQINSDGTIEIPQGSPLSQDTIVVTQDEKMVLRGWSLGTSNPSLIWVFSPRLHENIIGVTARSSNDPVASIGKALGDRNVLYKFLNPNLLVISSVNPETHTASFAVLDSVSGEVLYTLTHPMVDVTKPITCVVSENWFAYTVFSNFSEVVGRTGADFQSRIKEYQLVVSELFESPLANDRGGLDPISKSSSLRPSEADADEQTNGPHVVSQTYLLPAAVSFMTVSSTLQGITPRSLLCVVPSLNSLIAIPHGIFDPRRPVGRDATSLEAEEGLFRHDAALEYDSKWALNHMREIQGIQEVITSPSLLESTSLVFAFGSLDMFGTRIAPIGGFDILGKGFNRLQLIGTVAALALGTGVLAPLVRKKQTDSRWKAT